jgi:hypothetical protein
MIDPRIYLASRSPRRRELLSQIGVRFDLLLFRAAPREDAEVSEAWLPDETPEAYVQRVARIKAHSAPTCWRRDGWCRARCWPPTPRSTSMARSSASRMTRPTPRRSWRGSRAAATAC